MDIRAIGSQSMLEITQADHKHDEPRTRSATPDDIRTSKKFMMLSENLPILREQLAPRESVLKQHAKTIENMPRLSDADIDRMISKI